MTTPAREALDYTATPWLFIAAAMTIAPHFEHQPYWLSAFSASTFLWAVWLWLKNKRLPGKWVLALLVITGSLGILIQFKSIFGRDAGVALLVMLMSLKLLELKSRRDMIVIITLGYFLLLTHYLYSQSIPTGLWLLTAMWILTAAMIRIHGGVSSTVRSNLRYSALICVQAFPFMLVLYLLFPRVQGPLWGLPDDAHAGKTGLSEKMTPGSIADLAQSAEIAFRVRFDTETPSKGKLYWRGPVLENFDGTSWQPAKIKHVREKVEWLSTPVSYEITLEAHNQRWLLALDAPAILPDDAQLNGNLSVIAKEAITERRRYRLLSRVNYLFNISESPEVLQQNLSIPSDSNPRARELALSWQQSEKTPEKIIAKALSLFSKDFSYTLQPPLLGKNSADDFLFNSRRGFCEHFSAAFVVLMRNAGIPARVVTGYQGGELNPVDGFLVIRQSDAHAWAEVWLEGKGWLRVDPTAVVSPARIETGIANALPVGEALPGLVYAKADWLRTLRHRWEAINNAWNQKILGYDLHSQRELLSNLGFPDADWKKLITTLSIAIAFMLFIAAAWVLYHRPKHDPATLLWQKVLRYLAKRKVNCAPWETPFAIAQRIRDEQPALAEPFERVVEAYLLIRYSPKQIDLKTLRSAIAQLP